MERFQCYYENECFSRKHNPHICDKCENNRMRNYMSDFFIEAKNEQIPEKFIPAKPYEGLAEETKGYECRICHCYTTPYELTADNLCKWCGYPLFLKS